jgi:hypothetical protein
MSNEYQVPVVFDDGRGAFKRLPNPSSYMDPADPGRTIEPSRYVWHTVVTARTPTNNKKTTLEEITRLIEDAEDTFARSPRMFDLVALISGMPVHLRTNSAHLANFWGQNWYLGRLAEVQERLGKNFITIRAALDPTKDLRQPAARAELLPTAAAYFCPENRQIVFTNTDYYGQCKSWALGAAGVGLADFKIHSCHGAAVEIDGVGVVIIAPTGTGKSTYTNWLAQHGTINSDDWVYIQQHGDTFYANPAERFIYVRSNVVKDNPENGDNPALVAEDPVMRRQYEIFERCPAENVPVEGGRRVYNKIPNSRVLIDPRDIAPLNYRTRVKLVLLLRRDDVSPYVMELTTPEAMEILRTGEFMVAPGATIYPEEIGTIKRESWYNPYLLAPDDAFEAGRFAAVRDQGGAKYVIINTSSIYARKGRNGQPDVNELIDRTGKKILEYVGQFSGRRY